jgi:hypothetical protein
MYALISVVVSGKVLDYVLYGGDEAKLMYIISNNPEKITERILAELDVGVTYLAGQGAYSKQDKRVIMCVVRKNQGPLVELTDRIRKELPNKDIWCFSGYTIEEMISGKLSEVDTTMKLLKNIDVLVDGKFVEELKSLMLKFKGSSNQRTIMVKETLERNEIVLWDK